MQIRPGYFETFYRTNMQSFYHAGRLMQYQNNKPTALELLVISDGRTSDTCKGVVSQIGNGKALPSNQSFWQMVGFPPYHFNCRTTFRSVYDYELEKGSKLVNPKMIDINFKLAKGFYGNIVDTDSWWKFTDVIIKRTKNMAFGVCLRFF